METGESPRYHHPFELNVLMQVFHLSREGTKKRRLLAKLDRIRGIIRELEEGIQVTKESCVRSA
jgi:hypothetical protein